MDSPLRHSLYVRLGYLLAALLALHLCILLGLHLVGRHTAEEIVAHEQEENGRLLEGLLVQFREPLDRFTAADATSPERVPAEADAWPDAAFRSSGLDVAWVLARDGTELRRLRAPDAAPQASPLPPAQFAAPHAVPAVFYYVHEGSVYVGRAARWPVNAPSGSGQAWIVAAKRWAETAAIATTLGQDARLEVVPAASVGARPADAGRVRVERWLCDPLGVPVRALRLDSESPELALLGSTSRRGLLWAGVFGIMAVGVCGVCLWQWIVVPTGVMRRSLAVDDTKLLQPLLGSGGELEVLAKLVQDSMETRRQLERILQERGQLSRNLHDGVVQTIYAAGMKAAGARALIKSDPGVAAERLDQVCAALNAAVAEVRTFIRRLEPEPVAPQMMRRHVESICASVREIRPAEIELAIDDRASGALTPEQRVLALQVIREALARALRNSTASRISVRVGAAGEGSVVEVEDDGESPGGGAGDLRHFVRRAGEIGCVFAIHRLKPNGVLVRLIISPERHD